MPDVTLYEQKRKNLVYIYDKDNMIYSEYSQPLYSSKDNYLTSSVFLRTVGSTTEEVTQTTGKDSTYLNYKLMCSTQLTDGIWHQLVTESTGLQYASHFFERRIAIGQINYWVNLADDELAEEEAFYDEASSYYTQAWESLKTWEIKDTIEALLRGTISLLWNGLEALYGWVKGIFTKVWDGLVKVGKFIYSILTSFKDMILSIIDDIINNIEKILNPAIYLISLIVFMYVISGVGKLLLIKRRTTA